LSIRKPKVSQENQKYFCPITGAHFEHDDLCRRLEKFRVIRIFSLKAIDTNLTKKKKKKNVILGLPKGDIDTPDQLNLKNQAVEITTTKQEVVKLIFPDDRIENESKERD